MNLNVESLITSETKIKCVFWSLYNETLFWFIKLRVSSTLDKSVGKKYLIDGSPETCWSSQQVMCVLQVWIISPSLFSSGTIAIYPTRIPVVHSTETYIYHLPGWLRRYKMFNQCTHPRQHHGMAHIYPLLSRGCQSATDFWPQTRRGGTKNGGERRAEFKACIRR